MKAFIDTVLSGLVADVEQIKIVESVEDDTKHYEICAPKKDFYRLLGKRGQTMWAIRKAFELCANQKGEKAALKLSMIGGKEQTDDAAEIAQDEQEQ